jgi:ribosomal-protein-serine acetyltransferase
MFRLSVTPEIEIRQVEERDAEALYAVTDRHREYLREWLPWVDNTHAPEDTRRFIEGALAQYHSNRGPNAAIWMGGEIAGSIGCHPFDWPNRSCMIGYFVLPEHQGKGIVTRCCTALIDYLFHEVKLHRVVIQCATGNHKSCAIPRRLGFQQDGVLREAEWVNDRWLDLMVWSMLDRDWKR